MDVIKVYKVKIVSKLDFEWIDLNKDKIGVFIGSYGINLVNGEKLLIWIVDYVLVLYGIGVIMVVFVYDDWDFEFV